MSDHRENSEKRRECLARRKLSRKKCAICAVWGKSNVCWGGRNWKFTSDAQKTMARTHGGKRLDSAGLAQGIRRRGDCRRQEVKALKSGNAGYSAPASPLESFGIWMLGPALLEIWNARTKIEYFLKRQ